jgi:hypothetical protein
MNPGVNLTDLESVELSNIAEELRKETKFQFTNKQTWLNMMRVPEVSGIINGDDPASKIPTAALKQIEQHVQNKKEAFKRDFDKVFVEVHRVFTDEVSSLPKKTQTYLKMLKLMWYDLPKMTILGLKSWRISPLSNNKRQLRKKDGGTPVWLLPSLITFF